MSPKGAETASLKASNHNLIQLDVSEISLLAVITPSLHKRPRASSASASFAGVGGALALGRDPEGAFLFLWPLERGAGVGREP